jgi:phenylpyruvate tautomerase PptA (4-oxalocrotonate tautomerase family)
MNEQLTKELIEKVSQLIYLLAGTEAGNSQVVIEIMDIISKIKQ